MIPPRPGAMIQVNISDVNNLRASYMPFVTGGGLFIPSKQAVKLGQELLAIISLPDSTQKFPITGKVIWISPKIKVNKYQGFSIQLSGEKGAGFRGEVERILALHPSEEHFSYTM